MLKLCGRHMKRRRQIWRGAPLRGIARRHSICGIYSPQIEVRNRAGKTGHKSRGERGRVGARDRAIEVHRTLKHDSLKLQQTITCHRQATPCHMLKAAYLSFEARPLVGRAASYAIFPGQKNPIQPRSWIGQVRNAPRKAPISGEINSYICRVVLESETLHDRSSQHHFTRC